MRIFFIIRSLTTRLLHKIELFCLDFAFLFHTNKLYVYSWVKYKGTKLLHNNWGDDINKYFIEEISDLTVKDISQSFFYRLFPVKGYSCIGSILGIFNAKNYEVWGSGIIELDYQIKSIPHKIHSVRGPLTRNELLKKGIDCPEIYGDPALLISRYYRRLVDKQYKWGIIPHYIDEDNPAIKQFCFLHPECLLIKMHDYNDWHDIPDKIMQCHRILSSSLHGIIMADSYGIPNAWLRFSNDIQGGDFKYQDYFQSVNREKVTPIVINNYKDIECVINEDKTSKAYNINYRSIFNSCPFKEKLIDYDTLTPCLSHYISSKEKEMQYCNNSFILSEEELDKILREMKSKESELLFRGSNNASNKMFTSSQRHWIQLSDCMLSLGTTNYYQAINSLILLVRESSEVKNYMNKPYYLNDDLFILGLMQHFELPSPMIDFTHNLHKALCSAVSDLESVNNDSMNILNDFISIYILQKASLNDVYSLSGKEAWILNNTFNNLSFDYSFFYAAPGDSTIANDSFYVLNSSVDLPLVEFINYQTEKKLFGCLNIHKRLVPYIWQKYLCSYIEEENINCEEGDELLLRNILNKV